jgi:hypothetical protein
MEWHRIVGYELGSDGLSVDADLDGEPTPAWQATFGSPLDEDTEDAPRPTNDHGHLRLELLEGTELNPLVLLADYVLAANTSKSPSRPCTAA